MIALILLTCVVILVSEGTFGDGPMAISLAKLAITAEYSDKVNITNATINVILKCKREAEKQRYSYTPHLSKDCNDKLHFHISLWNKYVGWDKLKFSDIDIEKLLREWKTRKV